MVGPDRRGEAERRSPEAIEDLEPEAIEDLEPDAQDSNKVKGGIIAVLIGLKSKS